MVNWPAARGTASSRAGSSAAAVWVSSSVELLFYLPGFLPGHDAARFWTVNAARRTPAPVRRAVHPVLVVR